MSSVLTFDLGTSYFKVCLFDHALKIRAQQRTAVPVDHPASNCAELSVSAFERCLKAAVHDVSRQAGGFHSIDRICFASQANTFTLLDGSDQALIPFFLWTDERARGLVPSIAALANAPNFYAHTGIAAIDHHFMLPKIRWLQTNRPEIVSRARRLCGLADYLVWRLTGNHLTEAGIAGLTGLVDIHRVEYWDYAVQSIDLPSELLPQIVRAGSDAGQIRSDIAAEWGVPANCRVVMGCLDQYAGAIGAGNTEPGYVSETTGTVLATVRCAREFSVKAAPGVFQGPSFAEGLYYQMVFSSMAAGLLEQYRNQLPELVAFDELDKLAADVPAGANGLRLHPDAANRVPADMFIHRKPIHNRGHEVRAIMEGVAHELRNQVEALCGRDWPPFVRSCGGAARSLLWLQIKSDILGCPVQAVDCPEPTSLGAACLAVN